MDINSRFSQAAVIAAGIAFLGMCIKSGIDDFVNKDRVVTVKGLSEKKWKPTTLIGVLYYILTRFRILIKDSSRACFNIWRMGASH